MTKPSAETWNAGITACERGQLGCVGGFCGNVYGILQ